MEKEMLIYMINHEENFDKAKGMLDMFNVIYCTRYGFLNKRVVRFDNPDASVAERYSHCHDVWAELVSEHPVPAGTLQKRRFLFSPWGSHGGPSC